MMTGFEGIARKARRLAVGLMSGTSADGIDAAVVSIAGRGQSLSFEIVGFRTWPYQEAVREKILEIAQTRFVAVEELARLNVRLGQLFAEAALKTLDQVGIAPANVDFIGSHGQTVGHFPEAKSFLGAGVRATLQIGDPAVIAKSTGILTVGDFRVDDVAVGGTGAPLVPVFDWLMLRSPRRCVGALNVGGIANVTVIPPGGNLDAVVAFDTGPGNALLNSLVELLWGEPMDRDGRHAAAGRVDEGYVAQLLQHPYFQTPPPKSTGREVFGASFAEEMAREGQRRGLSAEDVMASATAFVARSIASSLVRLLPPEKRPEILYCSGGGVHNPVLMRCLRRELSGVDVEVRVSSEVGLDPDAKEAVAFAILADRAIRGEAGNCPGATGAARVAVLGKICLP